MAIWRHVDTDAVTPLRRRAQANTPAALYGCVMSETTAGAEIDESIVQGVPGPESVTQRCLAKCYFRYNTRNRKR